MKPIIVTLNIAHTLFILLGSSFIVLLPFIQPNSIMLSLVAVPFLLIVHLSVSLYIDQKLIHWKKQIANQTHQPKQLFRSKCTLLSCPYFGY